MRFSLPILLAATVNAGFLTMLELGDDSASWMPCETGTASSPSSQDSPRRSPLPTSAPWAEELRREKRVEASTFENDQTCGWFPGTASAPFTCGANLKCATNAGNVVGCVTAKAAEVVTKCFDAKAAAAGSCSPLGIGIGCCQASAFPACGTYVWTGQPMRSMFRCFPAATTITLNDLPQAMIDAQRTGANSVVTSQAGTRTDSATSTTTSAAGSIGSSSSSNIGTIIGGVVGGLGAIALVGLLVASVLLRRSKRRVAQAGKPSTAGYGALPASDRSGSFADHYSTTGTSTPKPVAYASTFPPQSPYSRAGFSDSTPGTPSMFSPNDDTPSDYDPYSPRSVASNLTGQIQRSRVPRTEYEQAFPLQPYPHHAGPQRSPLSQGFSAAELANTGVGAEANPAEMSAVRYL